MEQYVDVVTSPTTCSDTSDDTYCLEITIENYSVFSQIPFREYEVLTDLPLVNKENGLRYFGTILTLESGLESKIIVKESAFSEILAPYDGCFESSLDATHYI